MSATGLTRPKREGITWCETGFYVYQAKRGSVQFVVSNL